MATTAKTSTKKRTRKGKGDGEQEPVTNFRKSKAGTDDDLKDQTQELDEERSGQKLVPGVTRRRNAKVEEQALKVLDLQTKRQKLLAKEIAEREILTDMMIKAGIEIQDLDDEMVVEIKAGEKKAFVHKKKKVKQDQDED